LHPKNARRDRVVVTRKGKPVALVLGVEGMDEEQIQLGSSGKFWKLIEERRRQKTISRKDLEKTLDGTNGRLRKKSKKRKARL
jgi:antitoxin (DNA-binding transcriptional repressor) of toxin-antitoxin stability system